MGIFDLFKGKPDIEKMKERKDVSGLINVLKDIDSDVRLGAALALGVIVDKRAVEPLINAFKDVNSFVRINAALALGEIEDKRALEPLTQAL